MEHIISLLLQYKYAILFPLAIFEGPFLTVVGGFLVTQGIFNPFLVYLIGVAGDVIGDSLLYTVGRQGTRFVRKYGHWFGVTSEKLEKAETFFYHHHHKSIILSKVVHGVGSAGLVAAGVLKIPYLRYIGSCLLVSIPQSAVLLMLGILFGHAYVQIGKYLNTYAAIVSVVVLGGIILYGISKIRFGRK